MKTITTRLDEKDIHDLDWLADELSFSRSEILRKIIKVGLQEELFNIALAQYQKQKITLWRAAEIAKTSLSAMIDEARRRRILHQYSIEDFKKDLQTLERLDK